MSNPMSEFQACAYAGREVGEHRRFCRFRNPAAIVTLQSCQSCPYYGQSINLNTTKQPKQRGLYRDNLPTLTCKHRGNQVRTVSCELCGAKGKLVPVYTCARHKECTWGSWTQRKDAPKTCVGCLDFTEEASPNFTPLTDKVVYILVGNFTTDVISLYAQSGVVIQANPRDNAADVCHSVDPDTMVIYVQELPKSGVLMDSQYQECLQDICNKALTDITTLRNKLTTSTVCGLFRQLGTTWNFWGNMFALRCSEVPKDPLTLGSLPEYLQSRIAFDHTSVIAYDGVDDLTLESSWENTTKV